MPLNSQVIAHSIELTRSTHAVFLLVNLVTNGILGSAGSRSDGSVAVLGNIYDC